MSGYIDVCKAKSSGNVYPKAMLLFIYDANMSISPLFWTLLVFVQTMAL